MAFTIDDSIPPLVHGLGQAFALQLNMEPDSTPAPTAWSATGLPLGLSISGATGKISGAATEVGVFDVVATATGPSSSSDSVAFQIGITDRVGYAAILGGCIETDMEMRTGFVSVVNTVAGTAEDGGRGAILVAKRNDVLQIALGLTKDGELQDLPLVDVRLALKRYETDPDPLVLSDGLWWRTGAYEATRYLFEVDLTGEALASVLEEEADEEGTYADLLAEIQVVYHWWPPGAGPEDDPPTPPREIPRTSQEFRFRVVRDWIPED